MWCDAHLRWCAQINLRPQTIVGRRNILLRYATHVVDPYTATERDVKAWWGTRDGVSPQSRATELANVRAFYRWCILEDHRLDDPTARIRRPRLRSGLPRPIDKTELAVALATAPDRVRPMLYLAAYAGLRACEIATLRGEDVYETPDGPVVLVTEGKGDKQRIVPLHPAAWEMLPRIAKGWMFPRHDGKPGHVLPHSVSHLANQHLHDLGISATLHQLRHRFGTDIYESSGFDIRVTQDLLGHASPTTTARYAAWSPGAARAAVLALD